MSTRRRYVGSRHRGCETDHAPCSAQKPHLSRHYVAKLADEAGMIGTTESERVTMQRVLGGIFVACAAMISVTGPAAIAGADPYAPGPAPVLPGADTAAPTAVLGATATAAPASATVQTAPSDTGLPFTGTDAVELVVVGGSLIAAGAGVIVVGRRRRTEG